jgi:hypothetical protein
VVAVNRHDVVESRDHPEPAPPPAPTHRAPVPQAAEDREWIALDRPIERVEPGERRAGIDAGQDHSFRPVGGSARVRGMFQPVRAVPRP